MNRNFTGFQNGCTFPTKKAKQIPMAISIQAPKLQVPTTKIWFNMVRHLKKNKKHLLSGWLWYIMVYPPLIQFELDIHSNFKFTHSKSVVLLGSWCWQGIGLREIPQEMVGKCLR